MGTGSFPGLKRPGRGADHPPLPPSKCRGHERVELYLYSPSGLSWPVIGRTLPLSLPFFVLKTHLVCKFISPLESETRFRAHKTEGKTIPIFMSYIF